MESSSSSIHSKVSRALIIAGFLIILLAAAAMSTAGYLGVRTLAAGNKSVARVNRAIDSLDALRAAIGELETRHRDYLIGGDQYELDLYRAAYARVGQDLAALRPLLRKQADQERRLGDLERLVRSRMATLDDSVDVRMQMGPESALTMMRSSSRRSMLDDILRRIDDMVEEETLVLNHAGPKKKIARSTLRAGAVASFAALAALLLTAFYVLRGVRADQAELKDLSSRGEAMQSRIEVLDGVLGSMDQGVMLLDRDLKVIGSNALAEDLLKKGRPHWIDKPDAELESFSDKDLMSVALAHLQGGPPSSSENPASTEVTLSAMEKTPTPEIQASAKALRDGGGTLTGAVLLFRDVTEQKAAERELEASEASLINIFQFGLEAAFVASLYDPRFVGVNEGFLRLCGYSRDEVLGRSIEEMHLIGSSAELGYALDQARSGHMVRDRSVTVRTKSGENFDASLSVLPIEIGGLACMLFILNGISRRVRPSRFIRGLLQPMARAASNFTEQT
jgi:PAS domain S-box-containing protein